MTDETFLDEPDLPEPPQLRLLRRLVLALLVVLILGVLTVVGLLVIRLTADRPAIPHPAEVTLPDGHSAQAVTFGEDWQAVVSADADGQDHILIFDADGALLQSVPIKRP